MLEGKKTYLAAAGLAVYTLAGWALTAFAPDVAAQANVHIDVGSAIPLILNAIGLGGLRAAVAKS